LQISKDGKAGLGVVALICINNDEGFSSFYFYQLIISFTLLNFSMEAH
jgi:hypothetical protein